MTSVVDMPLFLTLQRHHHNNPLFVYSLFLTLHRHHHQQQPVHQPWLKYAPPRHVPRTGPSSPAYVPDAVRRLSRHVPTPTVVTSGPSKVDCVSLMGPRLRTVHTRTVPSGP